MTEVTCEMELEVRLANDPAELARLTETIAMADVTTLASCLYHEQRGIVMLLITDHALKTAAALETANFPCTFRPVILVRAVYEPQLAMQLGRRLNLSGIEVEYSYASRKEGYRTYLVFKTNDDYQAIRMLQGELLIHDMAQEKPLVPELAGQHAAA